LLSKDRDAVSCGINAALSAALAAWVEPEPKLIILANGAARRGFILNENEIRECGASEGDEG
jgi:hypothetical protein